MLLACYVFFFQAAVSALFCIPKKKKKKRFREYSKIRNFVTYQITFLMTCQQHKTKSPTFLCEKSKSSVAVFSKTS